jgi:catalase
MKEIAIQVLFAAAISATAAMSQCQAEEATPDGLVKALNGVFGEHKGARPVHAKGTVLHGTFTASADAAKLSKAPQFQAGASIPVVVRFSNFAGIPTINDTDGLASPRGMAIKFKLPDGSESDLVAHSYNGFPVATTNEFRDLLVALGSSKPDTPKPTPLDTFLGSHPIAKTFLTTPKPNPESYATLPYFGVNSFKFTNSDGKSSFVRYQIRPVAGEHFLSDAEAKQASANYLSDEIKKRVLTAPVKFELVAQIAQDGDKIEDPSITWPATRETVTLGTIALSASDGDDASNQDLVFMPNALPAGIEPADPMINARAGAYAVSFARRKQ